jgi:hypothetical protein
MKFGPSGLLGIAVTDRAIACAEIGTGAGGKTPAVRRAATFAIPEGLSLEQPQQLGEALGAFLRQSGFGGVGRAAVGLPAKWLIAIEKDVPPAAQEQAHAVLRLQAERLSVSESGEMVFDYAGSIDTSRANKVLLVGVPRKRLDQVDQLCAAAGVTAASVTSSGLTLARAANGGADKPAAGGENGDVPMLLLSRQGGEIVWGHGGAPRALRHVAGVAVNGHGPVSVAPLGSELSRTLAFTRANGASRDMLLWDGIGLEPDQLSELSDRSGLRVRSADPMSVLGLAPGNAGPKVAADPATGQSIAPALSLALAAADRRRLPVDFKRSRLAPPPKRRLSRGATWSIVGGAVLLLGTIALYVDVERRQSELDQTNAQVKAMAPEVKTARELAARVTYAGGFFGKTRPPYLDCLKELSERAFRDADARAIWATSFTLHANRKGQLQGKAVNEKSIRDLVDRIKLNRQFADVTGEWRDAGGKTREFTYTITFNYTYVAPE